MGSWLCGVTVFSVTPSCIIALWFSFTHLINMYCFPTLWQSLYVFVFYGCCNKVPQISFLKTTQMHSLKFLEVLSSKSMGWSQVSKAGFFWRLFRVLKVAHIPWFMDPPYYAVILCTREQDGPWGGYTTNSVLFNPL